MALHPPPGKLDRRAEGKGAMSPATDRRRCRDRRSRDGWKSASQWSKFCSIATDLFLAESLRQNPKKSSNARTELKASSSCPSAGSSRERLHGSIDVADWRKTGSASIERPLLSCESPQSASCYENYAFKQDVRGQTLRGDALTNKCFVHCKNQSGGVGGEHLAQSGLHGHRRLDLVISNPCLLHDLACGPGKRGRFQCALGMPIKQRLPKSATFQTSPYHALKPVAELPEDVDGRFPVPSLAE